MPYHSRKTYWAIAFPSITLAMVKEVLFTGIELKRRNGLDRAE
jgi:hypothetical protein